MDWQKKYKMESSSFSCKIFPVSMLNNNVVSVYLDW